MLILKIQSAYQLEDIDSSNVLKTLVKPKQRPASTSEE